jgi:hypothetical protein
MAYRPTLGIVILVLVLMGPAIARECDYIGTVVAVNDDGMLVEVSTFRDPPTGRVSNELRNITWTTLPGSMGAAAVVGLHAEFAANCDTWDDGVVRDDAAIVFYPDNVTREPVYAYNRLPNVKGVTITLGEGEPLGTCPGCCCSGEYPVSLTRNGTAVTEKLMRTGQSLCVQGFKVRMLEATVYGEDAASRCLCRARTELLTGEVSPDTCAIEDMLVEVEAITNRLGDPMVENAMARRRQIAMEQMARGDLAAGRETAEYALTQARRLDTKTRTIYVTATILSTVGMVAIAYFWMNRERKEKVDIF